MHNLSALTARERILQIVLRTGDAVATRGCRRHCLAGVYRIGGGVSAPVPIFRAEPEYSEEARAAKWQGAVLLQVVIDENGVPQDIKVVRSLGLGLDQKAIEAVQKWRFKPGSRTGNRYPSPPTWRSTFACCNHLSWAPAHRPFQELSRWAAAVMDSRVVQRVPPEYPPTARIARIQGTVQTQRDSSAPDGKVQNVQVRVSGPAMLTQAAMDAVWQWVYQPFLLNGQPVSVRTTATRELRAGVAYAARRVLGDNMSSAQHAQNHLYFRRRRFAHH